MLNRPATKIELKLEEDIIEYEETVELRRNNINNVNTEKKPYAIDMFTPESYKKELYYQDNNQNFSIEQSAYTPNNTP